MSTTTRRMDLRGRVARLPLAPAVAVALLGAACGDGLIDTKLDGDVVVDGVANVFVDATVVDFGRVARGVSAPAALNVSNTGLGTLTVVQLDFVGAEFSASGGAGITISPGATTALSLRYLPIDFTDDVGELTITTDDPDQPTVTVALRGGVVTDNDGDGFASLEAGGDDCDDTDARFFPGAPDDWYDGRDTNCDGADDFDQDGDGFQTIVINDDPENGGGDCQDANADMFPGAADGWYDGVDTDCDGSDDFDQDGDGFGSLAEGRGRDCDDSRASANPDAVERFNGVDDDCDGEVDDPVDATDADIVYLGVQSNDNAGWAMTTGDLDGDGDAELIIGGANTSVGRGAVAIFTSARLPADGSDMQDAINYIPGDTTSDRLGWDVSVMDAAGSDGETYLVMGAPYALGSYGRVTILNGYDARFGAGLSSYVLRIEGTGGSNGTYVGRGLSQGVDLNTDGLEDLVGWYQNTTSTIFQPHVYLLYGDRWESSTQNVLTLAAADARWITDGGNSSLALATQDRNFGTGADIDGDGATDWIFCDSLSDSAATDAGTVWALWGKSTRYSNGSATSLVTDASPAVRGLVGAQFASLCTVGDDLDGDGAAEIWTYTAATGELAAYPGTALMRAAAQSATSASIITYQFGAAAEAPKTLRMVGDRDGDGVSEVALGLSAGTGGQLYIVNGALEGEFTDGDVMAFFQGEGDVDEGTYQVDFGAGLPKRQADLTGDGLLELVVADPSFGINTALIGRGAVYIHHAGR